jgi:uncharacterized repeat protein (TIGR01451 family)
VGDGGSTGQLTLALGTHTVSERITAAEADATPPVALDQYTTSTSCVNDTTGAVVASGTGDAPVSVTLTAPSDDVVCTITNQRIGPSPPITPPGPPIVPTPPCGDYGSGAPECGGGDTPTVPQARLIVRKRMPARVQVGDRVPVTITVENVGTDTAHNVLLRDTPPGGGRLVAVSGHHAARLGDGSVVWRLGDLAPGETRTIHATMVIIATAPAGRLRNTVLANAGNADAVDSNAVVRVARPTAPAVTG